MIFKFKDTKSTVLDITKIIGFSKGSYGDSDCYISIHFIPDEHGRIERYLSAYYDTEVERDCDYTLLLKAWEELFKSKMMPMVNNENKIY